ncbi:MAG: peptide-N-glycosidase F-related protein [Saprospiraceae bacterium]
MRFTFLFIIFQLVYQHGISQDTTWVNTFNFNSKTRDTVVYFPDGDHNQYEKILMYYGMRCKGGLVSTGTDRNKGCGEWDYSCNTSIIDSSRTDSIRRYHPDYVINGFNEDFFAYTTQPTYFYTHYILEDVNPTNTNNIVRKDVGDHSESKVIIDKQHTSGKYFLYYTKEQIGLTGNTNLSGLSFNHNGNGTLDFLNIKVSQTDAENIDISSVQSLSFSEVVNRHVTFNGTGKTDVYFHTPFSINANMGLVFEISFGSSIEKIGNLEILGSGYTDTGLISDVNDHYLKSGVGSVGDLSVDAIQNVKNEITIAFWANGDAEKLPNNNSILYATDQAGNRQINVHLPWSNSKIYWDCGYADGGYDRVERTANAADFKGKWSFWTFTKNITTGSMKIYLNGKVWATANSKTKPIDIKKFVLGSNIEENLPYFGGIDDFTIWEKELTASEINQIMFQNPASITNLSSVLLAYYDMNDISSGSLHDKSPHNGIMSFKNKGFIASDRPKNFFKTFSFDVNKPNLTLLTGTANITKSDIIVRDSTMNFPYEIIPYSVVNNDLIQGTSLYYWLGGFQDVYDEDGNVIDEVEFPIEDILEISELSYFVFSPSKFEIMSFVTPYGIGLDLGADGKTWLFDLTDFGPILKGNKRLVMDKGGEYQEEMNLRFAFIKGTPSRNVKDIHQVWPVNSYNYSDILNNRQLEPREITVENDVQNAKVRVVTTGHGQEGEFIPRSHSININGGTSEFVWSLWKECADNPIYPQGGTWVYDRAGWCPGAPSDLREFEISSLVGNKSTFSIDYGLNTASGDSRYIVNAQVVKYGPYNFNLDAAIETILSPSTQVEYLRQNPICSNPEILVKNQGGSQISSIQFSYGVVGFAEKTFTWTGNLEPQSIEKITLPSMDYEAMLTGNQFFAEIKGINNSTDEYSNNNKKISHIAPVQILEDGIIVAIKTNSRPLETTWKVINDLGQTIKTSRNNMLPFTVYTDTIKGLSGCFQLIFQDSDEDGISWWANGDGDGYIRYKSIDGNWITLNPDFGKYTGINFVSGIKIGTQDSNFNSKISISPNPAYLATSVHCIDLVGETKIKLYDQSGRVHYENIVHLNGTAFQKDIDISSLISGFYYINVTNSTLTKTQKIIKL